MSSSRAPKKAKNGAPTPTMTIGSGPRARKPMARKPMTMRVLWITAASVSLATAGLVAGGTAAAVSHAAASGRPSSTAPPFAHACSTPSPASASCTAIRLLTPAKNWVPRQAESRRLGAGGPGKVGGRGGGGGGSVPSPPSNGYYPADLQSAYGLTTAASSFAPGPSAPTVAVVDAYDDPTAAADLSAYRASMSTATDTQTGLQDGTIPPLCSSTVTTGCVTFTKVNQFGGTSYPRATAGWSEEISVDLDMVSAICPACNIVLVEASSDSISNLAAAVSYAKSLHPAAIANSYGAGEFRTETTYNATYSASTTGMGTAVVAATGDTGYGAEFPAASPGLTAVGGTSLSYTGSGSSPWTQTVWSTAGAGCSSYEPMPTWQKVTGVYREKADCSKREIGDVAAVANPYTGVAVYDTYHATGWMVFGGTSVATQIIGATYGLAAGSASGTFQPSPGALYPDGSTGSAGPTPGLVPVTSGSDGSCGDYLCNAKDALEYGYNGPTGLGTPDGVTAFQTQPTTTTGSLSFSPASETLEAGTVSGPITVDLSAPAPAGGLTVTVSSPSAALSTSSSGPFASSMTLTVASGTETSPSFYFSDTKAGTATVSATATDWTSATLDVTVMPGPLAKIEVTPPTASVALGGKVTFSATGTDEYGNTVTVDPVWSVAPSTLGTFSPTQGANTTFTASSSGTGGTGTVTATTGSVSGEATVVVTSLSPLEVKVTAGPAIKRGRRYHVSLTVGVTTSAGSAVDGATVQLDVLAGSTCSGTPVSSATGTTGTTGDVVFTYTAGQAATWCASAKATKTGYLAGTGTTTFST